ncbi:MAG: hypothetical protein ACJAVS_002716, partial [Paracoccaceae bacterium]
MTGTPTGAPTGVLTGALTALCAAAGIVPRYAGLDRQVRETSADT